MALPQRFPRLIPRALLFLVFLPLVIVIFLVAFPFYALIGSMMAWEKLKHRLRAKPSPRQHPVFGLVLPDPSNHQLLSFRQFPHLQRFWNPDRERVLESVNSKHRDWVEHWPQYLAELSRVCRNTDVHAALQALGVYQVTID